MLRFDGRAETNGSYRIFSGSADDILLGGAGNDLIAGGFGADQMDGSGGADTYVYRNAAESTAAKTDTIILGDGDRIDLSAIDANTSTNSNDAFTFIGSQAFTNVAGQLRTYQANG